MPRVKKEKKKDLHLDEVVVEPKLYVDSDVLKCKILKAFYDKYTNELYEVGKIYEFTFKRIKEIQEKHADYIIVDITK